MGIYTNLVRFFNFFKNQWFSNSLKTSPKKKTTNFRTGFFEKKFHHPALKASEYIYVCVCARENNRRVSTADDVDALKITGVYIHTQYVHWKCTYVYVLRRMNVQHTCASLTIYPPRVRARDNSLRTKRVAIDWWKKASLNSWSYCHSNPELAQMLLRILLLLTWSIKKTRRNGSTSA